jgi:hypothetical protein
MKNLRLVNDSSIYDVAIEGGNVPKGKGEAEAYMLCYTHLKGRSFAKPSGES